MNQFVKLIPLLFPLVHPKLQNFVRCLISAFVILILIWGVLILIRGILKVLQTKEIKRGFAGAKSFGKILAVEIKKGLQLPTRYPFLELIGGIFITINSYLISLCLFAIFTLFSVLAIVTDDMSALKRLLALSVAAIFLLLVRFFFAEGERGRLSVPVLWRNFRKRRKS